MADTLVGPRFEAILVSDLGPRRTVAPGRQPVVRRSERAELKRLQSDFFEKPNPNSKFSEGIYQNRTVFSKRNRLRRAKNYQNCENLARQADLGLGVTDLGSG